MSYPLTKGQETTLFSCLHNAGESASVPGGKLELSLIDPNGKVIHTYTYTGAVHRRHDQGVADHFTPDKTYGNFTLDAKLYQGENLVDQSSVTYDCQKLDPTACPAESTSSTTTFIVGGVTDADTGAIIPCGSTVAEGTNLSFDFIPHEYTDVYWFATGSGLRDSPYGEWRKGAASPPTTSCEQKDYVNSRVGDHNGQAFTYYIYSALVVAPPSKHVNGVDAMSCGAPNENGSVDCTANTAGTTFRSFDFGPTIGKFDGRLWSPPYFAYTNNTHGCYGSNAPMVTGSDTRYAQPEFILDVPAQSISCPITIVPATDKPSKPTVASAAACTDRYGLHAFGLLVRPEWPSAAVRHRLGQ